MAAAVYHNVTRVIRSAHPTGDLAVAEVTALAQAGDPLAFFLLTSRINDANGNEANPPEGFRPGISTLAADGQVNIDPVLAGAELLKRAARLQRARICAAHQQLLPNNEFFPHKVVESVHDSVSWLHWGSRAVFLSTVMTRVQKLAWVQQSALGLTDVTPGEERKLLSIVRTWTPAELTARTPTARVLVCSPIAPYARFSAATARDMSNTPAVTAVLAADPTDLADIEKIATGEWIDDIV